MERTKAGHFTRRDANRLAGVALASMMFPAMGGTARASGSSGTITVLDGIDVGHWDPSVIWGHESYVLNNIYEGLTRYNTAKGKVEPELATSWSVSDDGLTWTFQLRSGVKFHGGEEFDAHAAKVTMDRNISKGSGTHYLWGGAEVSAPDAMTLVVKTKSPLPIDLISSGSYSGILYSPRAAKGGDDWFKDGAADGTGPYKLVKWEPNQQIVLERNADYWGGWKGNEADRVIVRIVSEVSTQLQMLRSGEADLSFTAPPTDSVDVLMKDPNVVVATADSWQYIPGQINVALEPTNNLKFRQALTHILDYEAVSKQLYGGFASVPKGPTPMAMPGAIEYKMPSQNLEKAKKLLEESGVPKSKWKITWAYYNGVDVLRDIALLFQANAAQVGVEVELASGDWGVMWDKQKSPSTAFNVFPYRNWPNYATIDPGPLFHSQANVVYNFSYYKDPQVDKWIEEGQAREAVDKPGCYGAWQKAYQKVIDDAASFFIADTKRVFVHRADLKGIVIDPAYETVFFRYLQKA